VNFIQLSQEAVQEALTESMIALSQNLKEAAQRTNDQLQTDVQVTGFNCPPRALTMFKHKQVLKEAKVKAEAAISGVDVASKLRQRLQL
jgi:hypothetical protein